MIYLEKQLVVLPVRDHTRYSSWVRVVVQLELEVACDPQIYATVLCLLGQCGIATIAFALCARRPSHNKRG